MTCQNRKPRGGAGHLPFTLSGYDIGSMGNDYEPESEAIAAMKLAMAGGGLERQRLFSLAMAWQELARIRAPLDLRRRGGGPRLGKIRRALRTAIADRLQ